MQDLVPFSPSLSVSRAVVHQPIEDGVGHRGIDEISVPLIDRLLARNDGRTPVVAIIQYLQRIALGLFRKRCCSIAW
jgi:hypothetical protein